MSGTQEKKNTTYLLGFIVLRVIHPLNSDYEGQTQSDAKFSEQVLDSTHSGFGDEIDNITDFNNHPRPCCVFQDVDTVLEFVFGVHYQVDLDVPDEESMLQNSNTSFLNGDLQRFYLERHILLCPKKRTLMGNSIAPDEHMTESPERRSHPDWA